MKPKVLILVMLAVAGLGAFMSSTGMVAIFIPVVLMICRRMNLLPKRLMMPLSVAGLISGMMTLIAMAPNLMVNAELIKDTGTRLRSNYGLNVVGIKRDGELISDSFSGTPYKLGDLILVVGDWKFIQQMRSRTKDFVVLSYPKEMERVVPARSQAPQALFSVFIMVLLMVSNAVPNVIAALIGCLLLGYFRCVDAKSAYDSIHWPSLILIIGMMPFATALQKTGGIQLAVEGMLQLVGNWGLHLVLMMLFLFCAVVGLFISNTATPILVAPIAISLAE